MNKHRRDEICERKRINLYYALIGFGAGTIVGATTALLLAPASGRETTAAIRRKWDDVSDKAGEAYGETKDAVSSTYEKTAAAIVKAKDRVSKKHNDAEEDA
ncbi:MAG: YtxH domain-containing protein [bacterium]